MPRHPSTNEFVLGRTARELFETQQNDAARLALEQLADKVPENPCIRMDLAAVLYQSGRLKESTSQLIDAARLAASECDLLLEIARRLALEGEIVTARRCLDLLEAAPDQPGARLAEQAHLRWTLKDIEAARRMIDRTIGMGAGTPRDYQLQAMLMQFAGEMDAAGVVLKKCLQDWPMFGDAALAQANLQRQTSGHHHLDFLNRQIARLPNSTVPSHMRNRAAFEAALFKELDDLQDHAQAWQALSRCNAIMHTLQPYDARSEAALIDAIIHTAASTAPYAVSTRREDDLPQPIFIVGMPRSGTTLLDRMLSNHSQIASAGELTDFPRQLRWLMGVPAQGQATLAAIKRSAKASLDELGSRYLEQTRWRAHARPYFVDKLPTNIRMLAHIRQALPHARVLHIRRDSMETCFSNLSVMFGNSAPYSYAQESMAHYFTQYARLARHWRDTLPEAMLEVSYADLVRHPMDTIQTILAYCELDFEQACLHPERNPNAVATPSSVQVREPIHTRSFDRWRAYAPYLQPLQQAIQSAEGHTGS